jgi:hypothetical protein
VSLSRIDKFTYKRIARGLFRTMLASSLAMRSKYPDKKYHSDYGKLALQTRPNWKQISETQFLYKDQTPINISKDSSVLSIIKSVYATEIYVTYEPGIDTDRYLEIIEYGNGVIDSASK